MKPILTMTDIDKSFNAVKALDKARLEVGAGEIHALIGANGAGKSTLMRILCGELEADGGEVVFDGERLNLQKGADAREKGIVMIHQELSTVQALTVAQYIFVGREPRKGLLIDDRRMEADAAELLRQMDIDCRPDALMGDLSIAMQQLVEISRALSYRVKLLILDEPTTALGEKETRKVFEVIRTLKSRGVAVIYISHRLEELFMISERITVMRDGKYIATLDTATTEKQTLICLLAGREVKNEKKKAGTVPPDADVVLQVTDLTAEPMPSHLSFSLRKGEVLGLAGLMGSGRTETAKAICGIIPKISGTVAVNGKAVSIRSPRDAAKQGICYLSEDRNGEGLLADRSIIANTVISSLEKYRKGFGLDDEGMTADSAAFNGRVRTKISDPHASVSTLSGGNAQKVIIARWLLRDCPVFIFDEPTKGIDVGAKDEIYRIIRELAADGHSVILISSETGELFGNCDRILVLWEGRLSGELSIEEATQEKLMFLESGEVYEKVD